MRIALLVCCFVFLYITCRAQDKPAFAVVPVTKVTVLSPGIGYEHPVGRHQTLYLQGMFSLSGGLGYSYEFGWFSNLHFDPAISLEYRYYWGWRRRLQHGKRVAMNSANYVAGFFRTDFLKRYYWNDAGFVDRYRKPIHAVGATVGMNRNYKGRFSLDLNIGFGHTIEPAYTDPGGYPEQRNSQFYFPGRLSLGIWLNKR